MPIKKNGFTLLELIITISLISILSAYASVKYTSTAPFDLYSATKNLVLDIRLAKTLSMSLNRHYRIVFLTSSTYQIQNESNVAFYNPTAKSTTTTLHSNVTISPLTTIVFNTLGQPLSSSNALLTTQTTVSLSNGTNTKSITIEPKTGYIHE